MEQVNIQYTEKLTDEELVNILRNKFTIEVDNISKELNTPREEVITEIVGEIVGRWYKIKTKDYYNILMNKQNKIYELIIFDPDDEKCDTKGYFSSMEKLNNELNRIKTELVLDEEFEEGEDYEINDITLDIEKLI